VGGWHVGSGGEQPDLVGLAVQAVRQDEAGVVAFGPGPGGVGRDPAADGLVEAWAGGGDGVGVEGGAGAAGGVGGVDRGLPGGGGLHRPPLGGRVDGVGVVQVAEQVCQALLDAGEAGVVGQVAAEVVADQDPGVVVEDPERGDRLLGAGARRAEPDQVRTRRWCTSASSGR
jgi:hypothetical protein